MIDIQKRFENERERRKRTEVFKRVMDLQKKRLNRFKEIVKRKLGIKIEKRKKIVICLIALLVIVNIALALWINSLFLQSEFNNSTNECSLDKSNCWDDIKDKVNSIKFTIIGIIVIIEILLYYSYYLNIRIMRVSQKACLSDNIITTGLYKSFLLEFFILGIFSPPYTHGIISGYMIFGRYYYSSDSLILLFIMSKLYYLFKIYKYLSVWASDRVSVLAKEFNVNLTVFFAFKAQIKHSPFITIFAMLISALSILGLFMRIFEYGYSDNLNENDKPVFNTKFKNYTEGFWLVIVSMMTIGYGDIVPNTHFGRIISFISSVIGMLIISLLIVTLSIMMDFNAEEQKSYNLILKNNAHKKLKKISICIIKNLCKLYLIKIRAKNNNKEIKVKNYINLILKARELAIDIDKQMKLSINMYIPSDQVLCNLSKKFEKDISIVGPHKYQIEEDITKLTNKIFDNEEYINNALNYLSHKQKDICEYLIKYNNYMSNKL